MRTRPWPLVLLALIQFFTPVMNVLFNAWILQVSPLRVLGWVLERSPLEIFQTLMLMPIAGLAIWMMKRWSYPVFFGALFWSAARNIANWQYAQSIMPLPVAVLIYVFELALVTYFLLPKVRTTYFDPTVRWWESKPRYVLELRARIHVAGKTPEGSVLNLSEGGVFLTTSSALAHGDEVEIEFTILGRPYKAGGRVVHSRKMDSGEHCYGVQFHHTPEGAEKFHALAQALSIIGLRERSLMSSRWESLVQWLITLLTTGKGWTPEPIHRKGPRD